MVDAIVRQPVDLRKKKFSRGTGFSFHDEVKSLVRSFVIITGEREFC